MSRPHLHAQLERLFESKNSSELGELLSHEDILKFTEKFHFKISTLEMIQAFTHSSFTHEYNVPNQEQLEFLGDSVLQLLITDEIYKKFPLRKEGHLSKLRSAIVNEKSLSAIGLGLGLNHLIIVGKGEYKKQLFNQETVIADTLEAVIAQIYRYHGLDFTKAIFLTWINQYLPNAFEEDFLDSFDAKSKLQEKVLGLYKTLPKYVSESVGSDFKISLWINDELKSEGVFSSKKIGEKELAKKFLKESHF